MGRSFLYPDPEAAVQWLLKAAEKNNDKAQFELGNAYLTGDLLASSANGAVNCFFHNARTGNTDTDHRISFADAKIAAGHEGTRPNGLPKRLISTR